MFYVMEVEDIDIIEVLRDRLKCRGNFFNEI